MGGMGGGEKGKEREGEGEHSLFCDIAYDNRPFSYSAKESGSSFIFMHFYTRDLIECVRASITIANILQNVAKYRSIEILFQSS